MVYVDPTGEGALEGAIPLAGMCVAVDGPIPVGDVVGGVILAGAATYDLYRYFTRCEECAEEDEAPTDEECAFILAADQARCEQWWKGRDSRNLDACLGSAMNRYSRCLQGMNPESPDFPPLSPHPWQY
jgi:hypothetical protein